MHRLNSITNTNPVTTSNVNNVTDPVTDLVTNNVVDSVIIPELIRKGKEAASNTRRCHGSATRRTGTGQLNDTNHWKAIKLNKTCDNFQGSHFQTSRLIQGTASPLGCCGEKVCEVSEQKNDS